MPPRAWIKEVIVKGWNNNEKEVQILGGKF